MTDPRKLIEGGTRRSREGLFGKITALFNRSKIEDSTWMSLRNS